MKKERRDSQIESEDPESAGLEICIPIGFQPQGGGHYFLQSLAEYLATKNWRITTRPGPGSDILFTNHWTLSRSRILWYLRTYPNLRVVQRIDGAAQDYGRHDDADARQRQVGQLADLVIFQSQYCRHSTRIKFPVIPQDGPVVHNPVDVERFHPDGDRETLPGNRRVACISWSTNPMKGAASIYAVAQNCPDLTFVLCGRYPDAPALPNILALGVVDRERLPRVLRSCDVLLTFSKNEACPNHVLEALASGLPVLYDDSGAMQEVIGDCGAAVEVDTFRQAYDNMMADLPELSRQARHHAVERYHPDLIFPQYMAVMEACLSRPLVMPKGQRIREAWLDPVLHPVSFLRQFRQ